jgi:hypothetical protein
MKEIDFHLLGLQSELCGVVCVLEREELNVVDASRSPDIERHRPHKEEKDEVSKTDKDCKSWILRKGQSRDKNRRRMGSVRRLDHPNILSKSLVVSAF